MHHPPTGRFVIRAASRVFAAAVALAASASAHVACAQPYDHLQCYKIKDESSFGAIVDLRPLEDGVFPVVAGCTVRVRSKQVCFPVQKALESTDAPSQDVTGQDLSNAFICYSIRCRDETVPDSLEMSDQFGTRMITGLRTSTICAPALLGPPPSTTTTTTTMHGPPVLCTAASVPACDGTCSNSNLACVESGGACICQGEEPFAQCGNVAGAPDCYGTCAGSQSCIDVAGACQCANIYQ